MNAKNSNKLNNRSNLIIKMVECNKCKKMFNSRSTLNRHMKNVHQEIPSVTTYPKYSTWSHHCLEENCDSAFASNKALIEHLTWTHNKEFNTDYLLMDDMEVFQIWKSKIERETGCYYVSKGKLNSPSGEICYYYCNRSKTGYIKKKQRSRNEKSQGSCKLNYSCTSQIKVTKEKMGVVVEWQKVHYGHTRDLRHLRLSKEERQYILTKLEKGETPTSIVQSFHKPNKKHLRRMHLLTVNDIMRIKRVYGIKSEKSLVNNTPLQNHKEDMNIWVGGVFSGDQQNGDMIPNNIHDSPLVNENVYPDNSICGLQNMKEENFSHQKSNSQIMYSCSSQGTQYTDSNQLVQDTSNIDINLNDCSKNDQTQIQAVPEITVFGNKPILVSQVRDMLLTLSTVNFEDLAYPILNGIHQQLSSMNELLGLSTDMYANEKINDANLDSELVIKEDLWNDKRALMDEEGNLIQAPDDSIILIVEDDIRNKVID